jgi:succinate dehydrogenase flavin-adding protein (antitoxin of CptAB toxin-antitoxin module)
LFEREIKKIEVLFREENGWDKAEKFLNSSDNKLFTYYMYPETFYELDYTKVIKWIKEHDQRLLEEIERKLPEIIKYFHDEECIDCQNGCEDCFKQTEIDGYNKCLEEVKEILSMSDNELIKTATSNDNHQS